MSAATKGYVVRGKDKRGNVVTGDRIKTTAAAAGAQRTLIAAGCHDVDLFAVAEDGTETPLPSYEEALAEIERIPGLEQANREAHQAIAALKAKAARVNEAWAKFYVASENVFVMAIGSIGEGRDLAPERAKREAARDALRALVADVDVLLKEADR